MHFPGVQTSLTTINTTHLRRAKKKKFEERKPITGSYNQLNEELHTGGEFLYLLLYQLETYGWGRPNLLSSQAGLSHRES